MIPYLELIGMAFLLGFVFNAAPGAVFAETVRRGMSGGYRVALSVQFGSLVGDAVWAILGLAGIGLLLQAESLKNTGRGRRCRLSGLACLGQLACGV